VTLLALVNVRISEFNHRFAAFFRDLLPNRQLAPIFGFPHEKASKGVQRLDFAAEIGLAPAESGNHPPNSKL
ncbi:MAG: hypothetical protein ACE5JJ_09275, partial [Nitrospinota bacterium]